MCVSKAIKIGNVNVERMGQNTESIGNAAGVNEMNELMNKIQLSFDFAAYC